LQQKGTKVTFKGKKKAKKNGHSEVDLRQDGNSEALGRLPWGKKFKKGSGQKRGGHHS